MPNVPTWVYTLLGNLVYDVLKGAIMSSPFVWAIHKVFKELAERRKALTLWGGTSLAIGLMLLFFRTPEIHNRPVLMPHIRLAYGAQGVGLSGANVAIFAFITNSGDA